MTRRSTVLITLSMLFGLAIPLRSQPAAAPGNSFDVRQFGATGKRADNAARALRAAVEACFAAGGGVVYVPPGEYTTGTIELKNNVNLHLEAGATLFLSQNKEDFGGQRTMIFASGAKNIAVTGRGTLDGLAQYEWAEPRGVDPEIVEETEIARRAGIDMRRYYRTGMQTFMFVLNDSVDVRLENITISNLQMFMEAEDAVDKRAADAVRIEKVAGCRLRNVTLKWAEDGVEPKWASAAVFRNVRELELDNFSGRQGIKSSEAPALLFENVASTLLRNSRADAGCGTFLSVRGSASRDIRLRSNDLEQARTPIEYENEALRKAVVTDSR